MPLQDFRERYFRAVIRVERLPLFRPIPFPVAKGNARRSTILRSTCDRETTYAVCVPFTIDLAKPLPPSISVRRLRPPSCKHGVQTRDICVDFEN